MARQYPVSLYNAGQDNTAADRRARAGVDVATSPDSDPTSPSQGFNTRYARYIAVTILFNDASTSADFELWCFDGNAQRWYLDTRLGTGGTVALASSDPEFPVFGNTIELSGLVERVYIKLDNGSGTFTTGVDVWISGVGEAS